ncbi:MAG: metal ABC transporter permease [Amoebophilaceae bacterium]|jgi:manganese/zinc/iron transport system permease protein|nr:metal ABC transporter permease [Amoebophilaceae bacterium]
MQQALAEFFSFSDPNIRYVLLGTLLLTGSAAMIGSFALLRKKVLVGDAVAHAVLPGVCLAFIITGTKHPVPLSLGASITGWLALVSIDQITNRSKIKEDTAIALVLSVTFGLGILLLTAIQHTGNAEQVGLSNFLFGKAAALVSDDLKTLALLGLMLIIIVLLFFKEFTLVAFDKAFAQASGLPVRRLELLLTSLTVLAIVVGIRAVGILLMAVMLITPPAAARFWTNHLPTMVLLAAVLGMIAGLAGSFVSYIAPAMPTGPWIVMTISVVAYGSFLLAPRRGLLARRIRQRKHQKKTLTENILKLFYELGVTEGSVGTKRTLYDLLKSRSMPTSRLVAGLKRLQKHKMLQQEGLGWRLTAAGSRKGKEISQRHHLWKLYLTQHLKTEADHTHEDAESIEHIITPELAEELRGLVKLPVTGKSTTQHTHWTFEGAGQGQPVKTPAGE